MNRTNNERYNTRFAILAFRNIQHKIIRLHRSFPRSGLFRMGTFVRYFEILFAFALWVMSQQDRRRSITSCRQPLLSWSVSRGDKPRCTLNVLIECHARSGVSESSQKKPPRYIQNTISSSLQHCRSRRRPFQVLPVGS